MLELMPSPSSAFSRQNGSKKAKKGEEPGDQQANGKDIYDRLGMNDVGYQSVHDRQPETVMDTILRVWRDSVDKTGEVEYKGVEMKKGK